MKDATRKGEENADAAHNSFPCCFSQRWILSFLFLLGLTFLYALRVNLSMALVCMVQTENTTANVETNTTNGDCLPNTKALEKLNKHAEFDWDKTTVSTLTASFFYGYIITQIPGGWLADRFGGKRVFGYAMLISAVITILLPVCTRTSVVATYILRVSLGLVTAVSFPAMQSVWGRWAPKYERSRLITVAGLGPTIGYILTFSTSGWLCDNGFDNGWGSIFYIGGGCTLLWVVLWFYMASDTPDENRWISEIEKEYINSNIEYDTAKRNGLLSSIPYIASLISSFLSGQFADMIRTRGWLDTTKTRKLFQITAFIGAGNLMVATSFMTCAYRNLAVAFLSLAVMFTGLCSAAYPVNHVDFAPKYAGVLYGITNTVGTVPGMVAPIVAGVLTQNEEQMKSLRWNYFLVGMAVILYLTKQGSSCMIYRAIDTCIVSTEYDQADEMGAELALNDLNGVVTEMVQKCIGGAIIQIFDDLRLIFRGQSVC